MSDTAILVKLTEILRDIFDNYSLVVTLETTALDVPGWDSIAQINLLTAVEAEYGIEFSAREMDQLLNIGDLVSAVARHTRR
jgi:acyl carrier protein